MNQGAGMNFSGGMLPQVSQFNSQNQPRPVPLSEYQIPNVQAGGMFL